MSEWQDKGSAKSNSQKCLTQIEYQDIHAGWTPELLGFRWWQENVLRWRQESRKRQIDTCVPEYLFTQETSAGAALWAPLDVWDCSLMEVPAEEILGGKSFTL